uniref:Uncharacterized protein n=1 Tax=Steinernema glaseri TaxID=37863 RepID=A0A1I7ZBC1_9BILA
MNTCKWEAFTHVQKKERKGKRPFPTSVGKFHILLEFPERAEQNTKDLCVQDQGSEYKEIIRNCAEEKEKKE